MKNNKIITLALDYVELQAENQRLRRELCAATSWLQRELCAATLEVADEEHARRMDRLLSYLEFAAGCPLRPIPTIPADKDHEYSESIQRVLLQEHANAKIIQARELLRLYFPKTTPENSND